MHSHLLKLNECNVKHPNYIGFRVYIVGLYNSILPMSKLKIIAFQGITQQNV